MRCKGCGYSLWNHGGRTCPECGLAFVPSEFEFLPNAVEFLCGGCGQQYYGTGRDGLLEPPEFACVRCGAACSLDAMVLRPAPGVGDDGAEVLRVAWQREESPAWRRFCATLFGGMVRPSLLGRAASHGTAAWAALRFSLLLQALVVSPTVVTVAGFGIAESLGSSGRYGLPSIDGILDASGGPLLAGAFAIASVTAGLLLLAACAWLLMRALAVPVRWTVAWGVYCYGTGALVIGAIPCCGPLFGQAIAMPWMAVSLVAALAAAASAPAWKAAVAVLVPPAVLALAAAAWIALAVTPAVQRAVAGAKAVPAAAPAVSPWPPEEADGDGPSPVEP